MTEQSSDKGRTKTSLSYQQQLTLDHEFWDCIEELVIGHLSPYLGFSAHSIKRVSSDQNGRVIAHIDGLETRIPFKRSTVSFPILRFP